MATRKVNGFRTLLSVISLMCALLLLASCGVHGKRLSVDTYRAPSDPSVLAVGQPINVSNTELNYAIGLRDVISVEVDEHSEFGGNFKVEEDGIEEIIGQANRVQQIEGDLKYGGQLGTEGFGKYAPGTPAP